MIDYPHDTERTRMITEIKLPLVYARRDLVLMRQLDLSRFQTIRILVVVSQSLELTPPSFPVAEFQVACNRIEKLCKNGNDIGDNCWVGEYYKALTSALMPVLKRVIDIRDSFERKVETTPDGKLRPVPEDQWINMAFRMAKRIREAELTNLNLRMGDI